MKLDEENDEYYLLPTLLILLVKLTKFLNKYLQIFI
jgi:hypothetical protein